MFLFGSHCSGSGGVAMAARRAGRAGMQALQIFTAPPKYYGDRIGVKPERRAQWFEALDEWGIASTNVIVHAAYVLNCATPDDAKWERAAQGLAKELERSALLGVGGVCFHPGAATDGERDKGCERITQAMLRALAAVPDNGTRLLIENTAGAGTTLGRTPDEIALMLDAIPADQRSRVGYGLDTCHLFASGYELNASPEELRRVLDAFEQATGEPPAFFHLNDSEGSCGSNKDRHKRIGEGQIGTAAFGWLLQDKRSHDVPLIMETPQERDAVAEDDDTPDAWDVESLTLLRTLSQAK